MPDPMIPDEQLDAALDEMVNSMADEYLASQTCSVGRELVWDGSDDDADERSFWGMPCAHRVRQVVHVIDQGGGWLYFCNCHFTAIDERIGGFKATPEEARQQRDDELRQRSREDQDPT